jgi:hypothetical protein
MPSFIKKKGFAFKRFSFFLKEWPTKNIKNCYSKKERRTLFLFQKLKFLNTLRTHRVWKSAIPKTIVFESAIQFKFFLEMELKIPDWRKGKL